MGIFSMTNALKSSSNKFANTIVMGSGFCIDPNSKLKALAKPLAMHNHTPSNKTGKGNLSNLSPFKRKKRMQNVNPPNESSEFIRHIFKEEVENRKNWFQCRVLPSSKACTYDNAFLFFNKPRGLACHGGEKLDSDLIKLMKMCAYPTAIPIHRLDKDTTGILVIGLNYWAQKMGATWFADGSIKKYYWALTWGIPANLNGEINQKLYSVKDQQFEKISTKSIDPKCIGKESLTKYKVIKTFYNMFSLIEFQPISGRKHQIRVHASECLKCPIVGDYKYGYPVSGVPIFGSRTMPLFLHCKRLKMPIESAETDETPLNPTSDEDEYTVKCPIPESFRGGLNSLEKWKEE